MSVRARFRDSRVITKQLQISCDEAGHTGPDLLHPDQRFFGFGSVAVSDSEASEIIQRVVLDHRVQMPELKAAKSSALNRGRHLSRKLSKQLTRALQ
jgi:hypothetical protein